MLETIVPSLETAKQQAKSLRKYLDTQNIPISHSQCLEALACLYGQNSWNHLSGLLGKSIKDKPAIRLPGVEEKIRGVYLKKPFAGKVIKIESIAKGELRRYAIQLDEPMDVVESELFSNHRQRITAMVNLDGYSVTAKKERNNILQIQG